MDFWIGRGSAAAASLFLYACASCGAPSGGSGATRSTLPVDTASAPSRTATTPKAPDPRGANAARGADALFERAELSDCVSYGLRHGAGLQAAQEQWLAASERSEEVGALPDPQLRYTEALEEVQTRTGPQLRRFGLSQALPWPGRLRAGRRAAESEAAVEKHRVDSARLELIAQIEIAFYDYAFLAQELRITTELRGLLAGLEPVVQSQVRTGGRQPDLLRLQVEIGRIEDDLASLDRRRRALSERLAGAMSLRTQGRLLPFPSEPEPRRAGAADANEVLQDLAAERSPELLAMSAAVRASQANEAVVKYRERPSFSLSVDYIQTGDAIGAADGSGDDPVLVGLGMSLPIWSKSYRAGERAAQHRVRSARARLRAGEDRLRARVEEESFQVDDATRRTGLYRESLLPRAREALELTLASYRTGRASLLDVIDSERALMEFELALSRSQRNRAQGEARLRALTGAEEAGSWK